MVDLDPLFCSTSLSELVQPKCRDQRLGKIAIVILLGCGQRLLPALREEMQKDRSVGSIDRSKIARSPPDLPSSRAGDALLDQKPSERSIDQAPFRANDGLTKAGIDLARLPREP